MNENFSLDWTIWPPERRHRLAHCTLSRINNANDEGCYLQHCSSQNVVRETKILEAWKLLPRIFACPRGSPPCFWPSTRTLGSLAPSTTGWPGPSLVGTFLSSSSSSFSSTTRLPGRRPGAQPLGLVHTEPALRDERGPHRLRRRGGAGTTKPLRLNAKEEPGTIIIAIIIITIIDPNPPSKMSKDLIDFNVDEDRTTSNPFDWVQKRTKRSKVR